MAHILIDGYNLIGTAHGSLEKARNDLIGLLQQYATIKRHDVTIVFDGWKSGRKDQTRIRTRHVTVIYSRLGETADVAIRKILSSSAKKWIMVSSDREVSDCASRNGFAAIHAEEFEFKMHSALRGEHAVEEDTLLEKELHACSSSKSGKFPNPGRTSPRKLSRTQRRKLKALRIL